MNESDYGRASEQRVIDHLGGRQTLASGALEHAKSDGILDVSEDYRFRIEAKATAHYSFSVKFDWLKKITGEARDTGRIPALTVSFVDETGKARRHGDWVMIPLYLFNEIFGGR